MPEYSNVKVVHCINHWISRTIIPLSFFFNLKNVVSYHWEVTYLTAQCGGGVSHISPIYIYRCFSVKQVKYIYQVFQHFNDAKNLIFFPEPFVPKLKHDY